MNYIISRHLDQQEELAIFELTLKKQRSKKSTVSEKNALAMQQLAEELLAERKDVRLKKLNEDLERLLCQYEALVELEKSILGAYNMKLTPNEGVNNFEKHHRHQQRQQQQRTQSSATLSDRFKSNHLLTRERTNQQTLSNQNGNLQSKLHKSASCSAVIQLAATKKTQNTTHERHIL